jgi:hypothetical protein
MPIIIEKIPILLSKFEKCKIFDASGMAPIHFHAENGDIEPLKCMIEADTVNMKSNSGSPPLFFAAAKVNKKLKQKRTHIKIL